MVEADLRPTFITRRISGHIGNGCFESITDLRLGESFVPELGREVIDRLKEHGLVRPRITVMQSCNVLAKLPNDILKANLPRVVVVDLFGHSASMMLALDVCNGSGSFIAIPAEGGHSSRCLEADLPRVGYGWRADIAIRLIRDLIQTVPASVLQTCMDDYSEPCVVEAFEGSVVIIGPGPMSGAFTPDAAEASALRLLAAANEA